MSLKGKVLIRHMLRICFRSPQLYLGVGMLLITDILVVVGNPKLAGVPYLDIHHIPELIAFACFGSLVDRMGFTRKATAFIFAMTAILGGIMVGYATYVSLPLYVLTLEVLLMAALFSPFVAGFLVTEWYYRHHLVRLQRLRAV